MQADVRATDCANCGREFILLTSRFPSPTLSDANNLFPRPFHFRLVSLLCSDLLHVHPAQGPQPLPHLSLRQHHSHPPQHRHLYLLDPLPRPPPPPRSPTPPSPLLHP